MRKLGILGTCALVLFLAACQSLPPPESLPARVPAVAHRGYSQLWPENTLEGMIAALDAGFDGVELDVRLSADGVPVLMHDATLDRTSNGRGPVKNQAAAVVLGLDAGSWKGPQFSAIRVPGLASVLASLQERKPLIMIEIKDPAAANAVLALLHDYPHPDRLRLISFDTATLRRMRQQRQDIPCLLLSVLWPGDAVAREFEGISIHRIGALLAPSALRDLQQRGGETWVWGLADQVQMQEITRLGLGGLVSDFLPVADQLPK